VTALEREVARVLAAADGEHGAAVADVVTALERLTVDELQAVERVCRRLVDLRAAVTPAPAKVARSTRRKVRR